MYCLDCYGCNRLIYRLYFIYTTLLCTTTTVVQSRYVFLANEKTNYFNNRSMFDTVLIPSNTGIDTLLDFMRNVDFHHQQEQQQQQQKYVSVLSDSSNNLLNMFMGRRRNRSFHHFDVNFLKVINLKHYCTCSDSQKHSKVPIFLW